MLHTIGTLNLILLPSSPLFSLSGYHTKCFIFLHFMQLLFIGNHFVIHTLSATAKPETKNNLITLQYTFRKVVIIYFLNNVHSKYHEFAMICSYTNVYANNKNNNNTIQY